MTVKVVAEASSAGKVTSLARVQGVARVVLPKVNPLVGLASRGALNATDPLGQAAFGFLQVRTNRNDYELTWSPVTVSYSKTSSDATLTSNFRTAGGTGVADSLQVVYQRSGSIATTVQVSSPKGTLTSVSGPAAKVSRRSADSAVVKVRSTPITLGFRTHSTSPAPTPRLQAFLIWLESSALALAPWLVLFVKFRRAQPDVSKKPATARRPGNAQTLPASWKGMRSLTLGLCFATVATGLGWLDIGLSSLPANTLTLYISGTAGPFAVLILGAWAWSRWTPRTRPLLPGWLGTVISLLALALAAWAVSSLSLFSSPFTDPVLSRNIIRLLVLGVFIAIALLTGLLLWLLGSRLPIPGGLLLASTGTVVMVGGGYISTPVASAIAKTACVGITAGFLAALVLCTLQAIWPERQRLAVIGGLTLGVASIATLWPGDLYDTQVSEIAVSASYSLVQIMSLALVIVLARGLSSRIFLPRGWSWPAIVVLAVVCWLRTTTLTGLLPVPLGIGIVLLSVVTLPSGERDQKPDRFIFLNGASRLIDRRSERLLHEAASSRLDRERSTALRQKIASGALSGTEESDALKTVQQEWRKRTWTLEASNVRRVGLEWGGTADAWHRAWSGALAAGVAGLPLSLAYLSQTYSSLGQSGDSTLGTLLEVGQGFRFPFYGFVFGLLFPILRGTGGLGKAARLFVVLAIAESAAILLPLAPSPDTAGALVLRLAQLLAVCGALGVWFDYFSVRAAGFGVDRLADLYNINRVTLWSSGVAVTLIASILSATLATAAEESLASLLPAPPPTSSSPTK